MDMEPPLKPDESDCCNSGCNPCILDIYQEQLRKYNQGLSHQSESTNNCMSPTSYTIFKLKKIQKQSKEALLLTFEYARPLKGERKTQVNVIHEPGQHFLMKGKDINGEEFTRAYTPIPIENETQLQFTTLVKLYKNGKMSNYLKSISLGDETVWRGPYGEFKTNYGAKFMLCIAQGTGIAPIYSILYNMIHKENCYTFLKLFFCCKDIDNIYLRDQLYDLSANWNFTYEVFLSSNETVCPKYNETIHKKKLKLNDIQLYLKDKQETINILICGSEKFMGNIKEQVLKSNVKEEHIFTL